MGNEIIQSEVAKEKYGGRLQIETPLSGKDKVKLLWGADYFKEETSSQHSMEICLIRVENWYLEKMAIRKDLIEN